VPENSTVQLRVKRDHPVPIVTITPCKEEEKEEEEETKKREKKGFISTSGGNSQLVVDIDQGISS